MPMLLLHACWRGFLRNRQDCGKSRSQLSDDLLEATRQKDPLQVKLLLAVNADARSTVDKMTVGQVHAGLLKASRQCNVEDVKVMLAMGGENVNVNARDATGKTALHLAVARRCPQVVRLLLDAKADVNAEDKDGNTPAMVLSYKGGSDPRQPASDALGEDIWYQLKAAGALVPDRPYESPAVLNEKLLDAAASTRTSLETVKGLLASGADVDTRDHRPKAPGRLRCVGFTPLHWAAATGNAAMVKELLVAGAKVNLVAKGHPFLNGTPLQVAATKGYQDVVKLLLAAGADVNAKDGSRPLHLAACKGHVEVAKLLLAAGANINAVTESGRAGGGWTPLSGAVGNNRKEMVKFLLANGADVLTWILSQAIKRAVGNYGSTDIVKLLLDAGARVSSKDIATAQSENHAELVRLLTSARLKQKSVKSTVSPGLP